MEFHTPNWAKHAVFYQIFPDRFARSPQHQQNFLRSSPWEDWDAPPTLQGYKGGDLWGIKDNLDYIQDLGITAIYFTPIFQSACNHRYHTHDYYQVDPILGGNIAFREFLDAAHEKNIKIVLDGVFNHCSRGFFFFHDVLENGSYSPWIDWFEIEDFPLAPYTGDSPANYRSWVGNRALPVFNHNNPQVREYLMKIAEYWIEFGIDGWRLDVPFEISAPGFWQEFRQRVKAINPEAYIVGEIWGDSRQWLDGTQFDGVMNYLFTGATIAFTGGDRIQPQHIQGRDYEPYPPISATEYATKIHNLLQLYPWEIQLTQLNLLASHDTARLLTMADGDINTVKLATLLLMTFPGAPSIYYGDEVGLMGGIDPDCRRGFPQAQDWNQELLQTHRQLIQLRHKYPCLRIGTYEVLHAQGELYVFARIRETEVLIIAVNTGSTTINHNLDISQLTSQPEVVIYGTGTIVQLLPESHNTYLELTIPPRTGCIIAKE
ncbi:glycoside hydrolase family 13 protein [Calothrix sp. 336/3]|uniref:glycoside hydrolase family 13 protein n=1 Tax=Calothrix sp. 336/3 TaxID=1337936 RepID=UPI0004E2ED90|nr:glycoside hydrolase family 13 protein [Calothrix sp. 336/3]AKG20877.1 alpha-amylase [Calothrix sp. 336/3]